MNLQRIAPLVLCLQLVGCAGLIQSTSLTDAYKSYDRGNYQRALEQIARSETITEPGPGIQAELAYLKARTYEQLGEHETAHSLYSYLAEQHADSQYGYLASRKLGALQ